MGGRRPALHAGEREAVFLVELSRGGLAEEQQGPAARPYLGFARDEDATQGREDLARVPRLDPAQRPCSGDRRFRLTIAIDRDQAEPFHTPRAGNRTPRRQRLFSDRANTLFHRTSDW